MAEGGYVSYLRVSTTRQGADGLGIEAQRKAVEDYLNGGRWRMLAEHVEVESGGRNDRPELTKALATCQLRRAKLIIAKLDRLSRDAHFLLGLEKAGVDFVCADMPAANRLTVGVMAMVAEEERRMISRRTREALGAIRSKIERGERYVSRAGRVVERLGNDNLTDEVRAMGRRASAKARAERAAKRAALVMPTVREIQAAGVTGLRGIARVLNEREVPAPRGGRWSAAQVSRVLALAGAAV